MNRTIIFNLRTDNVVLGAYADTSLSQAMADKEERTRYVHNLNQLSQLDEQKVWKASSCRLILTTRRKGRPDNKPDNKPYSFAYNCIKSGSWCTVWTNMA